MKYKLAFLSFALYISACSGDVSAVVLPLELPAPTLPATLVPSPTPKPYYLKMTVWVEEPRVPMLAYHQLAPDTSEYSTGHKVRVSDLGNQLEDLYLAGFTLVSVEDWIGGDISVPFGRKPLIISMDDLFFNNQITLGEDGIPTKDTAIGVYMAVCTGSSSIWFPSCLVCQFR